MARDDRLFDKVKGTIAASYIASSMGANCEGWSVEQIEAQHGRIDRFLPLRNCANYEGMELPPGTTEDGIERQKFMCLAMRDTGRRITSQDLVDAWLKYGDPEKMAVIQGFWDADLWRIAKSGVPASRVGTFMPWHDVVSFARSCHPVGVVNAGNPRQAAWDARELSQLYTYPALYSYGPDWAAAVCAAIAEAMVEGSTVDSVVQAATSDVHEKVKKEILDGVALAGKHADVYDMRAAFNEKYNARGLMCAMSMCPEIVTKGIAIFHKTGGKVVDAILGGVNFGRDTDCTAAVAGGIAGAFCGARALPPEWIETVDRATQVNALTVAKLSIEEMSRVVYTALVSELEASQSRGRVLEGMRRTTA